MACSRRCARRGGSWPLATIHRFTHRWEQAASVQLRHGHPAALDVYEQHGRVRAGTLNEHLNQLASKWIDHHRAAETVAITATSNTQVDAINDAVQRARQRRDEIGVGGGVEIGGGQHAYIGDVVVTRRNDRTLTTTRGDTVRNRDRWTVAATHPDGTITVTAESGRGQIRLPADYTVAHVRLGYAATEHGNQGVTVDVAYQLVSAATTRRGLYVGATRGRHANQFHVIAADLTDARDSSSTRWWPSTGPTFPPPPNARCSRRQPRSRAARFRGRVWLGLSGSARGDSRYRASGTRSPRHGNDTSNAAKTPPVNWPR